MDKDSRTLSALRGHVTRGINALEKAIIDDAAISDIIDLHKTLKARFDLYIDAWIKFMSNYGQEDGYEDYEKPHETFETNYQQSLTKFSHHIKTNTPSIPSLPTPGNPGYKLKLPDIKLAEFSGHHLEWTQFWNQFESLVDSRSDLEDITKYTYLTQCIKGPAKEILAGFRGQPSDYKDAIQALKSQYGDEKRNRRILVRKFINIGKPGYNKRDILSFKLELENVLMQMKHDPNINVVDDDWLINETIIMKLPKEVEDFLFNTYKTMYYNLTQIKEGLQTLIDYMSAEEDRKKTRYESNSRKLASPNLTTPQTYNSSCYGARSKGNAVAPIGTYTIPVGTDSCFFCQQNHKTHDCKQYRVGNISRH